MSELKEKQAQNIKKENIEKKLFSAKKSGRRKVCFTREPKLLIHVPFIDMVIILQVVKSEVIDFPQTNKVFPKA